MKIAVFGKIRSGKDTVGKMLIEEYGFNRYAFGDGIGEIIQKYFPEAWAEGKPRKHYQFIGQALRELNSDVWVNYLLNNIKKDEAELKFKYGYNKPYKVVVTDGRQVNEAEKLRKQGYLIIKVSCPEEIRVERMKKAGDVFTPESLKHDTELQVDLIKPDIEIDNSGTIEGLRYIVKSIMEDYGREGLGE